MQIKPRYAKQNKIAGQIWHMAHICNLGIEASSSPTFRKWEITTWANMVTCGQK